MGRISRIHKQKREIKEKMMRKSMVVADKKINAKEIILGSPHV